jgi:glycosyltransferase involved in cell wall biosynthesis
MSHIQKYLLSFIVPVYNEADGLKTFHQSLINCIDAIADAHYEIIYCDDGSTDETGKILTLLSATNEAIKVVRLSRNFGKEAALAAGIAAATGQAIIMLDGDGQHPVELIPDFVHAWQDGAKVVVGVRESNDKEGTVKRVGSSMFYRLFNRLSQQNLVPGSTDFRLIDHVVQREFMKLHETDRITRGLIDWLGYDRTYISFSARAREQGTAGYSHRKLVALAANSFVSLTTLPLFVFGYIGLFITASAFSLGLVVACEQLILGDPLGWKFTGTAMLSILLVFLVGIVLLSQGILALYISHINNQSKRRPLYIIDYDKSVHIADK